MRYILAPEVGRCALETILEILHFSLLDESLLLSDEILLFKLGFLLDMVLLHLILNILKTHGRILFFPVKQESFAKIETSIRKVPRGEVVVQLVSSWSPLLPSVGFELDWLWAAERRFHGEDVGGFGAELSPDGDSRCVLFRPAVVEPGVVVGEVGLAHFGHQKGEDPRRLRFLGVRVSVHEDVLASGVAV